MTTVFKAAPILAIFLCTSIAFAEEVNPEGVEGQEVQAVTEAPEATEEPAATEETPAEPAATEQTSASEASPEALEPTQLDEASTPEGEGDVPAAQAASSVPSSVVILTGSSTGGKRKSNFGGIVALSQSLGLGTFVADQYARNPYYGWGLSLRPRYFITSKLFVELGFSIQGELTQSYQSSNTKKRQVMPSDLFLTLKYQDVYEIPVLKIRMSPSLRLGAPTSLESRYRNLYLSGAIGLDLSRTFGNHFLLHYNIRFNKNFNRTFTPTLGTDVAVARFRGYEDAGGGEIINGVDNNTSFSVSNSLTAVGIINDQWSITLMLGIQNSWTYANIALDEFSSEYAKGGRGQRDSTVGTLDVSYQPFKHVGFSLGITSAQPAKTRDNKRIRFPFFDFSSEGNNFTQFYLDVYAMF